MSTHDDFGWRDRAIALASLGAAALSRLAFTTADVVDEKALQPLEMQVLVALALHDSLDADPPHRTGTDWLSRALRLERWVVEEIVGSLEHANLARRSSDPQDVGEIEYEFTEKSDDDVIADELPIAVTELGLQTVEGWLNRTRLHFGSWPPTRPDVDDAVG
jgi:DNA-binding MarR family transcriptional regulator